MYVVFDIGGSKMRISSSQDGVNLQHVSIAETPHNFDIGFTSFLAHVDALIHGATITKIVGGVAGIVKNNELIDSINLQQWANQQFAQKLTDYYRCPVEIENDAALGALGEALYGAGKHVSSIIYIALGTGIGGAWVVDGKLQSEHGAFEPGHQITNIESKLDLEQKIAQAGSQNEKETLLAAGLHNALSFWPSEMIILGGSKILHENWSLEHIAAEIKALSSTYKHTFTLKTAELNDESGLYGALHMTQN